MGALNYNEKNIKNSLHLAEDPILLNCKSGTEYLLNQLQPFQSNLDALLEHYTKFLKLGATERAQEDTQKLIDSLNLFSNLISETIVSGKITSITAADLEQGERLSDLCKSAGTFSLVLLEKMKSNEELENGNSSELKNFKETMNEIVQTLKELLPKVHDISKEEIGDLIEQEMHNTSEAIEAAVAKLEVIRYF